LNMVIYPDFFVKSPFFVHYLSVDALLVVRWASVGTGNRLLQVKIP